MKPPTSPICYPPAALNGGPLESALPKVGEWVWQPKVDDWRAVVHAPTGTVWNQDGKLSSCPDKFRTALAYLFETWKASAHDLPRQLEWLDVGLMENRHDLMRGCIIVFDWMRCEPTHRQRRAVLEAALPILPYDMSDLFKRLSTHTIRDNVFLISQWPKDDSLIDPLALQLFLKNENEAIGHKFYEGLVAKRVDSLYTFGRKPKQVTDRWIKHRFDQGGYYGA